MGWGPRLGDPGGLALPFAFFIALIWVSPFYGSQQHAFACLTWQDK